MSDAQLIIFDCDGVLVDSEPINNQVLLEICSELGWPLTSADGVALFKGRTNLEIQSMIEEKIGYEINGGLLPLFLDRVTKHYETDLLPIPGILTLINGVNVPYCVVSNGERIEIEKKLEITGLSAWFTNRALPNGKSVERIYSAGEIGKPKPDPSIFLMAAEAFGIDPANCLVIEDGAMGIEGAKRAGMLAVGLVASSFANELELRKAGADEVFGDAREILAYINR